MQEGRNLFSHFLRLSPAWSISSGHTELGSGASPDGRRRRALANFSGVKSRVILLSGGVGVLQSSDSSLFTSLAVARSLTLQIPFFTSCNAIKLAAMGQGRDGCLFLPVRLFNVSHASRVEWVKSIVLTASLHLSRRFSSRRLNSARAALLVALPMSACKKAWCRFSHSASQHG